MDNKEFKSFINDAEDFMECTCNSGEAYFDFSEDELYSQDSVPFVDADLNNFGSINLDELTNEAADAAGHSCGCSGEEDWHEEDSDSCRCNNGFDEYIGEVEVNNGCCGHHGNPCCKHGNCENQACFKQDGNCEDDCFKPCKPHPRYACLKVYKHVDKNEALDGETLRYCIKIENKGNATAFNIKLTDILPTGLTLIKGSLKVSGCHTCHKGTLSNLSLGSLEPCETIKITFEARIACGTSGVLTNFADVTYCYATSRCGDIKCDSARSNNAVTNVTRTPITMLKVADRNVVSVGEDIVYTISVTNNGLVKIDNFTLQDNLDSSLCCKEVRVGTTTYPCDRLSSGINIGSLNAKETKDVVIRARVQEFPTDGTISNMATGRFTRNGQTLCPVNSNVVSVTVVLYMCRPATIEDKIRVSCANGPVHTVTDAVANVKIIDVKEERNCSCEDGRYKKVRVSGIVNLCIKYDTCSGCEKKIIKKVPFCITIKVPRSFVYNKNYCITVEPKEICTKICCGFEIATIIKLLVCLVSL